MSSALSCRVCLSWHISVSSDWQPFKVDGLPVAFPCIARVTLCSQPSTTPLSIRPSERWTVNEQKKMKPVLFSVRKNAGVPQVLTSLKTPGDTSTACFLFDLSPVLMASAPDFLPTDLQDTDVWLPEKGSVFSGRRWLLPSDYQSAMFVIGAVTLHCMESRYRKKKKKGVQMKCYCYKK